MKSQKKDLCLIFPITNSAMSVRRLSPDIESQLLLKRIDDLHTSIRSISEENERLQRQHDQNQLIQHEEAAAITEFLAAIDDLEVRLHEAEEDRDLYDRRNSYLESLLKENGIEYEEMDEFRENNR
jgi:hypothetical protein